MGFLLNLEGIDGCGKTTISSFVEKELTKQGISAKRIFKKYTDYDDEIINKYADTIKNLIWYDNDDPYKFVTDTGWLYMHSLWYAILVENYIKPNLNKYDVLIVDGWFYKIYSRFLLKEDFNKNLLKAIFDDVYKCNHVIMLDVSPDVCWRRRTEFKPTEIGGYENNDSITNPSKSFIEYQGKVRDELLKIGKIENWTFIDIDDCLSINDTTNIVVQSIKKIISK